MKKMCCPLTGAYIPSLLACTLVGFTFLFGLDSLIHGKLLTELYNQTPKLWRTEEEMGTHLYFLVGMEAALAFITAAIYSVGHEGRGLCEGIRFGLLLGLLLGVLGAMAYAYLPISKELAQAWFFVGLAQGLGLGVVYSLVYKSPCCDVQACGTGEKKKGSCGTGS